MKTKAQLNWEVGKECELSFLKEMNFALGKDRIETLKELFAQIRQNEYRRGKEDALKEQGAKA